MSSAVTPPSGHDQDTNRGADGDTGTRAGTTGAASAGTTAGGPSSREVVRQQKERFGGMKFGSCFFGWLTATGTALLLTALLSAVGAGVGLTQRVDAGQATDNARTIGLVGGIVLLVVIFIAYLAGGYVAGRMARFNGAKQGIGVWLWALIIAVVVAVLGAIAGDRFNLLANLNGFPRIPVNEGDLTTGAIITAVAVALAALLGAVLGGLAGMRYHRRVDRATHDEV
ncbi:hypothetical protein SAMN04488543_3781 [Friedmanniella luteola]|uniref:Uncharacterized protein n=1 Tax=Friedmanniella luteola TaxID=546871 RepID=A0A1H1ZHB4_9ACTN|nr:hypothetical protein [Friedmanniella luteola]SDT33181.1 hypothetical protein SAMN04488543_3781 [Friedmanniella luteola]